MPKENLNKKETEADRELVFTRTFNAPREMVWKMWTDPKALAKWWGPNGFSITTHSMEFKVGGIWRFVMHGPDGRDYQNKLTYNEITKPERLVFSHGGDEKELQKDPVSHVTTATFEETGGQTTVTMRLLFPTVENRNWVVAEYKADEGGKQTLNRLGEVLEKAPFVLERSFKAPIDTVWKALTDHSLMVQWYFPMLEDFQPKVGFETQFTVSHNGKNFPHLWKVKEVIPNKKISYSWKYGDHPGDSLLTFELSPEGKGTKLTLTHEGLESFMGDKNPDYAKSNFAMGWNHIMDTSLRKFLGEAPPEFVISRTFDAPRELVWKAWNKPDLMAKWFGPKGISVVKNTMDLRPGGTYHYCMRTPDGNDMWGKFVYREITAPEKLVFVNSFSDAQGGITRHPMSPTWPLELLSTITLEDVKGKTKLTINWTPLNANDEETKTFADGMASMQQGWGGTLEQLEAFLATT